MGRKGSTKGNEKLMSIHYESRKECRRFGDGFFKWLLQGYWSVSKWGEREWGIRILGVVIDNESKGGTI